MVWLKEATTYLGLMTLGCLFSHVLEEGVCLELVEKIVPSLVTLSKEEPLKQEVWIIQYYFIST